MVSRKGGLGRGLTALIPQGENTVSDETTGLQEVNIELISANRYQPRQSFDDDALDGLVESVKALGILQPILVRATDDGYELIAGERRWRAASRAGLTTIPVIIKSANDENSLEQALVENLHRQDLNVLEEAAAYLQLIDDFGLTQDEVAQRVGKSRSSVANHLRLFQLSPTVQQFVRDGLLSAGHAKALLGHPDRSYQEGLAKRVAHEGLSVREVEALVKERLDLEASLSGSGDESPTSAPPAPEEDVSPEEGTGRLRPPGLLELEELLADFLDTRVNISMTSKHGKVGIDFANLEDLERIYRRIIGD